MPNNAANTRTRGAGTPNAAGAGTGTSVPPAAGRRASRRLAAESPAVAGRAPELDRLIHERLRLGIVSALAVNETLSFNDLKALLKTTDGNLSVHARKLEEAGYVVVTKYFEGRMPKTDYRLTPIGRHALERYLEYMERLIRATRGE
jgi:DNA-binding HxlR family transcriptional regulator